MLVVVVIARDLRSISCVALSDGFCIRRPDPATLLVLMLASGVSAFDDVDISIALDFSKLADFFFS
jgi:hypothetical protein